MKKLFIYGLLLPLFLMCKPNTSSVTIDQTYAETLDNERKERDQRRKKYLELCGLFKLDRTGTLFGINAQQQVTTNPEEIKQHIGKFKWNDTAFDFEAFNEIMVTDSADAQIQSKALVLNAIGDSELLFYNHFKWRIITRSGALYLRVWDEKNPALKTFKGFEIFEPNAAFILDADFEYFETSKYELVASKLGIDDVAKFIGSVHFYFEGDAYTLDVGQNGWIMVGDATSGDSTYGGGRYMYIDLPEANGKVQLDFNYLYNPPCSFSEYTTCLFPPRQNRLSFPIEAGELLAHKK